MGHRAPNISLITDRKSSLAQNDRCTYSLLTALHSTLKSMIWKKGDIHFGLRTTKRVVFFKLWVNFYGIRLSSTFFSLTVQCAHEQYQAWMDERNQKPYFFILFDSFCFIFCVRCAVIWEKLSPEVFVLGSWVPKTFNVKMYFADGNRIRILQYSILLQQIEN